MLVVLSPWCFKFRVLELGGGGNPLESPLGFSTLKSSTIQEVDKRSFFESTIITKIIVMSWDILHIPGKPPSSLEHSTVNVVAVTIEPKLANTLVRQLNQICPLEDLRHVKRVRRINSEGKVELSVILCISRESENVLEVIPSDVLQVVNTYQFRPFIAKVAKYAAMSKEEWEEQCKLWPTSYHPPNNLDGVSGFSAEESQSICKYMKIAIQLTGMSNPGDQVVNAAVIVDPSSSEIIAEATDQTGLPPTSSLKICSNHLTVAGEAHSASSMAEENGLAKQEVLCPPRNWLSHCTHSFKGVACLNPRGWIEQRPCDQKLVNCGSNFSWHPLRHATLVAIENAAERDRKLFPNLDSSVNSTDLNGGLENDSNNGPAKRLKTEKLEGRQRFFFRSNAALSMHWLRYLPCLGAMYDVCHGTCSPKDPARLLRLPKSERRRIGQCPQTTWREKLESPLLSLQDFDT